MYSTEKRGQKRGSACDDIDGGGKQSPCVASVVAMPDVEGTCFICLHAAHESGQSLRRDCSCRGGSGFAHLPCIVGYAEYWSRKHVGDLAEFAKPWSFCQNCNQPYQNELALDLGNEFVSFVKRAYPGHQLQFLKALMVKLKALKLFFEHPGRREEGKQLSIEILSIISIMRKEESSPSQATLQYPEAEAYFNLGFFASKEGTEESAKTAVEHFEKSLDIYKATGMTCAVALVEVSLARAKAQCGSTNRNANENVNELLEKKRTLYKQSIKNHGNESSSTIISGLKYAISLRKAGRGICAERLGTKLVSISRRVHGPNHNTTRKAELWNQKICMRVVRMKRQDDKFKYFQALRYDDDGKKCVLQGPVTAPGNVQREETITVAVDDFDLSLGTPIICHGLKTSTHLNGKIGEPRSREKGSDSYMVHFVDNDLEPCLIRREFLSILFELPHQE